LKAQVAPFKVRRLRVLQAAPTAKSIKRVQAPILAVGLVQVVALITLKPLKSRTFLMQKLTNKLRVTFTAPGIALVAAVVIHRAHQ
jgi:hypothetical protein